MAVNSITQNQTVQTLQAPKPALHKNDAVLERKQIDTIETDKAQARKAAAGNNNRVHTAQEPTKASVNTNGQTVGTRINTSA